VLSTDTLHRLQSTIPALIFFDIDGTLLNSHGHYSLELKQQLQRLSTLGVKLAIASGRPAIAAQFLFDDLPLHDAGLFCTGAELYYPKQKRHLQLHCLNVSALADLYKSLRAKGIYCEFYTQEYYTSEAISEAHQDIRRIHSEHLRVQPRQVSGDELLSQRPAITKLLLGVEEKSHGHLLRGLSVEHPQFEFAFAHFLARPEWLFASVVSREADKHKGFEQLLAFHEVSSQQVMAFGDSHSDQVFLQRAGLGVAMATASAEVMASADIVTLSADHNGVAEALKYIL
jgi:Cof subfamily protein (haloacid dehalogenase superfamily)